MADRRDRARGADPLTPLGPGPLPGRGLVVGAFDPPHAGHVFLCRFARRSCARLTLLLLTGPDDAFDGEMRAGWLGELFPDAEVVVRKGSAEDPDPARCRAACAEPPEVVFAGHAAGRDLAAALGARFVPVDFDRTVWPVTSAQVRGAPFDVWPAIPGPVRPAFVRRVCLFGPESTGKSTLGRALAERFDTLLVPEYGRLHTEVFGQDCNAQDIARIVAGHLAGVEAAARQANRLLIEDTDPVLTAIWSDVLTGARDPWFDRFDRTADLYLLTGIDVPFTPDAIRFFPDEADRVAFHDRCRRELETRRLPYVDITGPPEVRLNAAVKAIGDRLGIFPSTRPSTEGVPSR